MLGFFNRFIDSNEREVKRIQPLVDQINALEPEIEALPDDEIRARIAEIRAEILEAGEPDEEITASRARAADNRPTSDEDLDPRR